MIRTFPEKVHIPISIPTEADKELAHSEPSAVETRSTSHQPKYYQAVPHLFPEHGTSRSRNIQKEATPTTFPNARIS